MLKVFVIEFRRVYQIIRAYIQNFAGDDQGLSGNVFFPDGFCQCFEFGDDDFFIIIDAPDNVKVAAGSLIASATGAVSAKVTVLLTPEEVDEVSGISVEYRPPGQ